MGWYADPAGSSQERYWDGANWTANLRDAPEPVARASKPHNPSSQGGSAPVQPGPVAPTGSAHGVAPQGAGAGGKQTMTADGVPLAGWWWRVFATIVDQVLIGGLAVIPAWVWIQRLWVGFGELVNETMVATRNGTPPPTANDYSHLNAPMLYLQLTVIGVAAIYWLISYLTIGRTVGNIATGTWVVRVDRGTQRGRLSPVLAGGRTLAITAILLMNQILPVLWLVDVLLALITKRRQTLHDLLASTQVVRPSARTWR